jgi:hypothetical protein
MPALLPQKVFGNYRVQSAKLVGKQLTDEVHYRFVYDRDGSLRSYSMGVKKGGKWTVQKDELCLYLGETDDGCKSANHLTPNRLPTLTPPTTLEVIAPAKEISSGLGSRLGADRGALPHQ